MYKKEMVLIANPMSQVIKQAVKSKSNKSILALNKNLTYWLMQNIKRLYD